MADEKISNNVFKETVERAIGITKVHNYYGMVEQTGSIFFECEQGYLHVPNVADISVVDQEFNACDFGDLILHCVSIFENKQDILDIYSNNFKYILVDEYQDTNFIQSKWLNLLAKKNAEQIIEMTNEVSKLLYGLIKSIKSLTSLLM